jgi:hypothetical protein
MTITTETRVTHFSRAERGVADLRRDSVSLSHGAQATCALAHAVLAATAELHLVARALDRLAPTEKLPGPREYRAARAKETP